MLRTAGFRQCAKRFVPKSLLITHLKPSAADSVLFTFDDGPHPDTTPGVLDRLRRFGARAIFFVVGNRISQAPELLQRVVEEGHWLGNHTFTHPKHRNMPYREYLSDLQRCQQLIIERTGRPPRFHRPPRGAVTMASLTAPKRCGLTSINWSLSANDCWFRSDEAAEDRASHMIDEVSGRDVLLFHDERPHTLVALDRLLPALKQRGLNLSPELHHIL